jgi:large subunit ribosomal protein L10
MRPAEVRDRSHMNRDQKAATIAEIAAQIDESQAIFAVDYKGISVPQAAELRAKLREADATFRIVKNSLTERAADQATAASPGAETLKALLEGPTALTFVRGDAATAAKALAEYGRATQLLPFKGGLMDGSPLEPDQIRALSRLPSREVLYGRLVGIVASPVAGLVRTLGALVGGLAVALGQVQEKKQSGDIPSGDIPTGDPPAPAEPEPAAEPPAPEESAAAEESAAEAPAAEAPAAEEPAAAEAPAAEAPAPAPAEEPAAGADDNQAEPGHAAQAEPIKEEDKHADVSADAEPEDAETNPTKED